MAANITLPTTRRALRTAMALTEPHGVSHAHTPAAAAHDRPCCLLPPSARRSQHNRRRCAAAIGCCHCCDNHRQARLQGGARARSTRQALYLCTLLKRTTSIRASAGPQRPTHRPPLTTHHSLLTTHSATHTSLSTTHCPPLANACFFAPLHRRQEPGCRLSCLSCLVV
jgi:hypothetical protein